MAEDGRILPIVDFHYSSSTETSVKEHYTGLQILTLQRLFIEVFFIFDVENTAVIYYILFRPNSFSLSTNTNNFNILRHFLTLINKYLKTSI